MTPGDWLLEQFEKKLEDFKENGVFLTDDEGGIALDETGAPLRRMGLGSVRHLIELVDDMADHGYPYCSICKSWDKRWPQPKKPLLYPVRNLLFPVYRRAPGPYLQAGLPPV